MHLPHNKETEHLINKEVIFKKLKRKPILINTARGMLVDVKALIKGLKTKHLAGYLTDVLAHEPMLKDEILLGLDNVIITPHIGSRTYESVQRQGVMAVNNLLNLLKSEN